MISYTYNRLTFAKINKEINNKEFYDITIENKENDSKEK